MQFSQDPALYSQISLNNPLLIFALGLLFGSIIGINGLIILGLLGAGYYYREPIGASIQKLRHSDSRPTWWPK